MAMTKSWLICGALLACLPAAPAHAAAKCPMSADERAWIDGALKASDYVMEQRLHLPPDPRPTIILFNDHCRFESSGGSHVHWIGTVHGGKISLPDGSQTGAVVTSFASRVDRTGQRFFVMALPSVWYAAKIMKPGDNALTAVFLHEFSHTRQMDALQPRFAEASAIYKMPDDFNDDSLQAHFKSNAAYVAAYQIETDLLYRAAEEPDVAKSRALARQALSAIEQRQKRWFVGDDAKLKPYDDLFLTMEGFGQWSGYAWLSDPKGGGLTTAAALSRMHGSRRWWTQEEGLGLFLVIDRLLPNWAQQAFGSPPALGLELLRRATVDAPRTDI